MPPQRLMTMIFSSLTHYFSTFINYFNFFNMAYFLFAVGLSKVEVY